MTTAEQISGRVEARNERGIRVLGEWRNLSKFHPLELPDVGAHVSLGLDPKGFITTLEVLEAETETLTLSVLASSRDQRITRLAVLKAAAAFGASRPDLKSSDVLRIADCWLKWVEP